MKAAWIRNFWTKTVAFLLAAALVPVILTYVVGLVYSYGGMGRDFYTSNLCLNAVGKKTWEICDDYIAMEGGNYELDKIYSKGDSYSNIRFRVTDEQDKVEFSNVSDGDTFCYSTVYVDKTFDVYLVKGLPAQDDIYWAKVFYDKAENWGQNALELLILFGAMELFLLIFLARTAARREDGELQGGWQEKIPFDLYLLVDGTIIALLCVAVEEVYSYVSFYTPPYDVLLLAMSFALAVLVFAAWVTFCARVKVGGVEGHDYLQAPVPVLEDRQVVLADALRLLSRRCGFAARHPARLAHGGGLLCGQHDARYICGKSRGRGDAADDACAVRRRVPLLAPASKAPEGGRNPRRRQS